MQASSNLHRASAIQQRRPAKRRASEPAVRASPLERRRSSRTEVPPPSFPPCIQRSCICQAGRAVCPVLAQSITWTPALLILFRASRHRTTVMTHSTQRARWMAPSGDALLTPSLVGIAYAARCSCTHAGPVSCDTRSVCCRHDVDTGSCSRGGGTRGLCDEGCVWSLQWALQRRSTRRSTLPCWETARSPGKLESHLKSCTMPEGMFCWPALERTHALNTSVYIESRYAY